MNANLAENRLEQKRRRVVSTEPTQWEKSKKEDGEDDKNLYLPKIEYISFMTTY